MTIGQELPGQRRADHSNWRRGGKGFDPFFIGWRTRLHQPVMAFA
jgi:hypothetical protein